MRVNDVSPLSAKTLDLMEALVNALRYPNAPVLSEDELKLIRAKVAGGTFDDLDAGALLDHIDYLSNAYEQLVQRSGAEADRAQVLVLEIEQKAERYREALLKIAMDSPPDTAEEMTGIAYEAVFGHTLKAHTNGAKK